LAPPADEKERGPFGQERLIIFILDNIYCSNAARGDSGGGDEPHHKDKAKGKEVRAGGRQIYYSDLKITQPGGTT